MDCRVTMLFAYFVAGIAYCLANESPAESCRSCREGKRLAEEVLSPMELREARIEMLKLRILQKLRLEEPPKPSRDSTLPSVITSDGILGSSDEDTVYDDKVDDYYGTTQNIVLFPDNATSNVTGAWGLPSASLQFHIDQLIAFAQGTPTAHLWVYKNLLDASNLTFVVYDVQPAGRNVERRKRVLHVNHITENALPKWYKYDVTAALGGWQRKFRTRIFEIDCYGCQTDPIVTHGPNRPFVIISADPSTHVHREKRNIECSTGTSHCCREEFYLSFEEIRWDNWIIHPKGYKANFCRGSCGEDFSIYRYHHTALMQRVIRERRAQNKNVTLSLCCAPSKMSPLTLLYENNGTVYQKHMPNMVVETCDCT